MLAVSMTIINGTDLEMGTNYWQDNPAQAITSGRVPNSTVEASWRRVDRVSMEAGRFNPVDMIEWTKYGIEHVNSTEHQTIQLEAALQSFVLLEKDNRTLLLTAGRKLTVLGQASTQSGLPSDSANRIECWDKSKTYGCIEPLATGIARTINVVGGQASVLKAVDINSDDDRNISRAVSLAQEADVVILITGIEHSIEREGQDRNDTDLPGMEPELVRRVLACNNTTILIISNGGPLAIDEFIEGPAAIVEVFNPAHKGARALAMTLFGESNRFGKLPYTMYSHDYIQEQDMTNYDMSKAPGRTYRYYTGSPLYPFGHGLS
eukprot:TRINITY_DN6379_c0_g2_i1.p1 TRINITY_DN6379_c0_g2~~TRINITY_DN6379_c0_g2_i1.p1  ORF type:complete len:321 (+),score=74.32 TRINITY_DN6379_c0_g2_i1:121-1083(+)